MQSQNRFFDDLAKILNGAAGTFAGMGREAESNARERFREFVGGADFVTREEFNAVKQLAATARAEADALKARVEALEAAQKGGAAPRTAAAKSAAPAKPRATKAAPKAAAKPATKAAPAAKK